MKGFVMTLEVAEKFYKRCGEQKATTEAERLAILKELIHEENIKILKDENAIKKELDGKRISIIRRAA